PGKRRWRATDLIGRQFAAEQVNRKWYGDGTEIAADEGKLILDSVLDMGSRRIVGFALGEHHDADLAYAALAMAIAVRGGKEAIAGVICTPTRAASTPPAPSAPRATGWVSGSRWAGPARRWTTPSSRAGTAPWSSSCAALTPAAGGAPTRHRKPARRIVTGPRSTNFRSLRFQGIAELPGSSSGRW